MPWPALVGAITAGGRALAGAGIIRGTVGRLLGGGARGVIRNVGIGAGTTAGAMAVGRAVRARPGGVPAQPRAGDNILTRTAKRLGAWEGERRHYRRMNAGNAKALRRAVRRVKAFEKLAKDTIQITQRVRLRKRRR